MRSYKVIIEMKNGKEKSYETEFESDEDLALIDKIYNEHPQKLKINRIEVTKILTSEEQKELDEQRVDYFENIKTTLDELTVDESNIVDLLLVLKTTDLSLFEDLLKSLPENKRNAILNLIESDIQDEIVESDLEDSNSSN